MPGSRTRYRARVRRCLHRGRREDRLAVCANRRGARLGRPFVFRRAAGAHRALELIYTGRLLSGAEAAALGLVNQSMARDSLLAHARKIAAQVAQGPTAAFMQSKHLVRRIDEEALGLFAVLKCEAQAQGAAGRTADYKEGITAFQQKRTPKFQGK